MLPAEDGDCLLIDAVAKDGYRTTLLVDGGRAHTYPTWGPLLRSILGDRPVVDLFVVTHIDADHIGGALAMLEDAERNFVVKEIWFNGFPQVQAATRPAGATETLGVAQADDLEKCIVAAEIEWNKQTAGGPLHAEITTPRLTVGHLTLTVLTPTKRKLGSMAGVWAKAWAEAKAKEAAVRSAADETGGRESMGASGLDVETLARQDDDNDSSRANGSSLGLLVEAFGSKLLLAGDCHPDDLAAALKGLRSGDGKNVAVEMFKISHHGARRNTTRDLLASVDANTYAVSTNGRHGHPEDTVLAKIVTASKAGKVLAFNYRTKNTESWNDARLKAEYIYEVGYPSTDAPGHICFDITAS